MPPPYYIILSAGQDILEDEVARERTTTKLQAFTYCLRIISESNAKVIIDVHAHLAKQNMDC